MGADCDFPNPCDCGCCATPDEVADALRDEVRSLAVERAERDDALERIRAEIMRLETAIDTWANERARVAAVMTTPDRNLLDVLRGLRANRRVPG